MNKTCAACKIEMTKCRMTSPYETTVTKIPVKIFSRKESSRVIAYTCPKCGHIELEAEKPENLK